MRVHEAATTSDEARIRLEGQLEVIERATVWCRVAAHRTQAKV